MKTFPLKKGWVQCALALLALSWAGGVAGATVDQVIELRPGWNAVYVEVQPEVNDIDVVFAGIAVESVWRFFPPRVGLEFIRDPAEGLQGVDGWFGYFPEPRPEAFLTNLFTINANTAYLVKLDSATSQTLTITGRPELEPVSWQSDSFSLRGLRVDPDNPPTFGHYFETSPAHQGQPVYRLDENGRWQLVSAFNEFINSGEAYWIFTSGVSSFQGTLSVNIDAGDTLEFSGGTSQLGFTVSNNSDLATDVIIERVGGNTLPLSFLNRDEETGEEAWPDFQMQRSFPVQPGEDLFIRFGVKRTQFTAERMEQIFTIRDGMGSRVLMFAGGNTVQPVAAATLKRAGLKAAPASMAGLWIGRVNVRSVSEAQLGGTTPLPTTREFTQRILIHVNAAGVSRLVKDVIQMWEEGTEMPSASDPELFQVDTPGREVLLTDKNLVPSYSGIAVRNGVGVGVRYSTIAYDFEDQFLEFSGDFDVNGTLGLTLVLDPEMPTNPFRHKFHPDHDNLDAQFLNFRQEAYQVSRILELQFSEHIPGFPDVADPPDWGDSRMGGVFRETLTGLHKNAIFVEGDFQLQRVSAVAELNQ